MRPMTAGEIQRMVQEQSDSMLDVCFIGVLTESTSASGGLNEAYVDGLPTPCSLMAPKNTGIVMVDKVVVNYTGLLRVKESIAIGVGDRITIISRNGLPASEVYYVQAPGTVYRTVTVYPLDRTVP